MVDVAKLMRRGGVTIAELAAEMQISQKRVRSYRENFHRTLRPGQSAFETWREFREAVRAVAMRKALRLTQASSDPESRRRAIKAIDKYANVCDTKGVGGSHGAFHGN